MWYQNCLFLVSADVYRHKRSIFGVGCPNATNEDKDTAQLHMALQVLAHGGGSDNRDEDGTNDGCELRLSPWEGSFLHDPLRYLSHAQ
jgi:hypothetical protein